MPRLKKSKAAAKAAPPYPKRSYVKSVEVPDFVDANRRYSIPVSAKLLGQSIPQTFRDLREKKLTPIREGNRTYVPGSEIIRRSTLPTQGGSDVR